MTLAITAGSGTSGAQLTCTTNPLSASGGVASFGGCAVDRPGTLYTLTATDGTLTSAVSSSFTITVAVAASGSGTMTVSPTSVTAGSTGNTLVFTFTAPVGGTFAANSYVTLTVPAGWTAPSTTSGSAGYTTATAGTCTPGALSVTGSGPWTIQVTQACAAGTSFTINYGIGTNATHVTAPATAGTANFNAASHAGFGGTAVALANSPIVTINAGSANKLVFTTQPVGNVGEATNFSTSPSVSVEDSNGNVVTSDTGNVTLAINSGPGAGTLSCSNSGFPTVAAVAGVAAFTNCQITGTAAAGTYTLVATRSGLTGTGASSNVVINVGSANQLAFTTQPVGNMGEATNFGTEPKVSVEDSNGNVVTSDTGSVALAINSYTAGNGGTTQGTLACTVNTVNAVAGVATFANCQITGTAAAGTYTLKATRSGLTTGTSNNVVINAGFGNKLVFTTQPVGNVGEGDELSTSPSVSVEDSNGNVVTSDTGNVTLAINSGPGAGDAVVLEQRLPDCCRRGRCGRIHQLPDHRHGCGRHLHLGRDPLRADRDGASSNVVINVGSANQLAFTTQPVGNVGEATNFGTEPKVSVEDSNGNVVTSDTGSVALAINSYTAGNGGTTQGTLACTANTVNAVAGVATFANCQITGTAAAGTYTLKATRSGLTTGTSNNVVINAGSANKLVFTTQPCRQRGRGRRTSPLRHRSRSRTRTAMWSPQTPATSPWRSTTTLGLAAC